MAMNPFDVPQAEGKKQMYTRDRNERGQFSGSLLMGNSIPAEIAEGHKEDISKRSLLPRMIKPAGIPKPPKPVAPGGAPKMPKPATVPSTKVATPGQPRVKQTGLGVRKNWNPQETRNKAQVMGQLYRTNPQFRAMPRKQRKAAVEGMYAARNAGVKKALYASVPTTKKEQRRERLRNAAGGAAWSSGGTAALTLALNRGRGLRAAGQGAAVMAPIGGLLGASATPRQRKMVQVSKRGERGELKAYQFANHEHVRSSSRREDKVLARERVRRRVSKMSPDPSSVHVMGGAMAARKPRSRAADQARAQRAALTRRLRPLG